MSDLTGGGPAEPWPGYAHLTPEQRESALRTKVFALVLEARHLAAAAAEYERAVTTGSAPRGGPEVDATGAAGDLLESADQALSGLNVRGWGPK